MSSTASANYTRACLVVLSIVLVYFPATASARNYKACIEQASSVLEARFCEIKQKDPSVQLPSFEDFKNNQPKIQHLLLKRAAQRLGISLPKPYTQKPSPNRQTKDASTSRGTSVSRDNRSERVEAQQTPANTLNNCKLIDDTIRCKGKLYNLVRNKKNSQLKAEAFYPQNTLNFVEKSDSEFKDASDFHYLSALYPEYIYKMLEIGLGDSTMSFTKFATVYWQTKKDRVSFVERFAQVYNQLKIEKSRNQIQSRYNQALPQDIASCAQMDQRIVVCDNAKQNWLFQLR